jgi:hypothetical protein
MDLSVQYSRDLADVLEIRLVGHHTVAHRRIQRMSTGDAHGDAAIIVQAQAEDLVHMTADALATIPGLGNLVAAPIAALTTHIQQMNTNLNAQMQQMNTNLNAQMQKMNTNFNSQMQQMNSNVNAQLQQMNNKIDSLSKRLTFRVNSNAFILTNAVFYRFPNVHNVVPDVFPRTNADLMAMTGQQMTALLHAYGIENVPHNMNPRRERVKNFIITEE